MCYLAKLRTDSDLHIKGIEKLKHAIELGSTCYNLACVFALVNDKNNALRYLSHSLENKEISIDVILNDKDWDLLRDDNDFIDLIKMNTKM